MDYKQISNAIELEFCHYSRSSILGLLSSLFYLKQNSSMYFWLVISSLTEKFPFACTEHIFVDYAHSDYGFVWLGVERYHCLNYFNSSIRLENNHC